MGRRLQLREVTNEERQAVKRLAHSRTASARAVERARVVQAALEGQMVEEIAADQRLSRNTVYVWMHRFEKRWQAWRIGAALDAPGPIPASRWARSWQQPSRGPRHWACLSPRGRSTGWWPTLRSSKGISMKRSRLSEVLLSEGLRWRKEETWFGERVDPDFAAKRGRSSASTPSHWTEA